MRGTWSKSISLGPVNSLIQNKGKLVLFFENPTPNISFWLFKGSGRDFSILTTLLPIDVKQIITNVQLVVYNGGDGITCWADGDTLV